ncbi:DNA-directed RNA polymerase, mitochondrial [Ornithorhynchus anatinus]|uniref:DNA-directed RNA polymerase n=1 Tax=Ornithorhynchus anatinus TaxID=9258 RepID=A0A6I8N4P4_ORNAN|nr:DNA-directed RNA polymerase, mitochondrial [Ornithorhynchus anatinus]
MSVLRLNAALSRGAAGLGWIPRIESCPCCRRPVTREAGRVWAWVRRSSSASTRERDRRRDGGRVELLEVLEARVKQLQAEFVSEVTVNRVELAPLRGSRESNFHLAGLAARGDKGEVGGGGTAQAGSGLPGRWEKKLNRDKTVMQKRQQKLEAKLRAQHQLGPVRNIKVIKKFRRPPQDIFLAPPRDISLDLPRPSGDLEGVSPDAAELAHVQPPVSRDQLREEFVDRLLPEQSAEAEASHGGPAQQERCTNFQKNFLAYLECCVFTGQLEQAQIILHQQHCRQSRQKLLTLPMYNTLLRGWAKKGSLPQIRKVFSMLWEASLTPNLESYAAALECLGRRDSDASFIASCLQQMKDRGYQLKDLFQDVRYFQDQKKMVLTAIRKVDPNFAPPPPPPPELCTSPLLRDFYAKKGPVSYPKLPLSVNELQKGFQEQLKVERATTLTISSVEEAKPLTDRTVQARELLTALRQEWKKSLRTTLRQTKTYLASTSQANRFNLFPYLCLLKDTQYVDTMMEALSTLPPHGDTLFALACNLGAKVHRLYKIQKQIQSHVVDEIQAIYKQYVHLLAKDTQPNHYLPREYWEALESKAASSLSSSPWNMSWPHTVVLQLGIQLVEILVQSIKMPSNLLTSQREKKLIPILYHVYSFRSNRQIGFIRPHPTYNQLLVDARETSLTFDATVMPMLCPPVPWTSPHFGAYILSPTKLMRSLEGTVQHQQLLDRCPRTNLHSMLDALNQLGNCAWKVNRPVLDLIISVFNAKGSKKLGVPPPLSEAPPVPVFQLAPGDPPSKKTALLREIAESRKVAAEMYSLRVDALYKLSIAHHLRNRVFWFPHNMDFRGRTYPCPPHFNHLGGDYTRALLLFAEGKPLGPHGLDWLKIHLVNLTGLKKKQSLRDRLAYANEILEDILDSADRPMTGKKWWMDMEDPWQVLACCMEIARAIRSPDPAAYISHFPVHQDGSCNGLQHYAALGRDVIGATSVNLMPCDTPQDVYEGVAQQVEQYRKKDAEKGVHSAQVLEGYVNRKLVKQTVMTVVYGVTRYGGRLQIEKRLKEIEFPKAYIWEASHYLVHQVFNSLKEMFTGTREIQLWLTESARLISRSGQTVEWVTPLGLPLIQPYHRDRMVVVNSNLQRVSLRVNSDTGQKPNTMKQKNAFPPNFIHSLDSTHMMLTALHCYSEGLTFVSVHDCFWTHASTLDVMNKVCREQFVNLHSQPILQNLSDFLVQKYCSKIPLKPHSKDKLGPEMLKVLARVPATGDFDLQKVKESVYFFS